MSLPGYALLTGGGLLQTLWIPGLVTLLTPLVVQEVRLAGLQAISSPEKALPASRSQTSIWKQQNLRQRNLESMLQILITKPYISMSMLPMSLVSTRWSRPLCLNLEG